MPSFDVTVTITEIPEIPEEVSKEDEDEDSDGSKKESRQKLPCLIEKRSSENLLLNSYIFLPFVYRFMTQKIGYRKGIPYGFEYQSSDLILDLP